MREIRMKKEGEEMEGALNPHLKGSRDLVINGRL
jgi:hypothetical protein